MVQAATDSESITAFLDQLINDGGLGEVEPQTRQQMITDLRTRLQNSLFTRLITKLPESDLPAFDTMLEQKAKDEDVQNFLRERIPNIDEHIAQAMLDFRKGYVKE
jgi:hypothetical protein